MATRTMNYRNLNKVDKSSYKFDANTLRNFINFILSLGNTRIRRSDFYGLKSLVDSLDMEYYSKDTIKMNLLNIINQLISLVVDCKITNAGMLMSHVNNLVDNSDKIKEKFHILTDDEIHYISLLIRKYNSKRYFFDRVDDIIDMLTQAKVANAIEVDKYIDKACELMEQVTRDHNVANSEFDQDYMDLEDFTFEQNVTETYKILSNPSNVLLTGMQGFNDLLGGGIELGRGYVIMGLSGEGKSGLLLNIAVQIKKNNKDYKTKDPNLKPCIAYITQENSKVETIERLYNITTDLNSMVIKPLDQVIHDMRTTGEMIMTPDNPMNLAIIYKEPFTNDTTFFHEVIDTMRERGYEVVCILHDYLQRINSANPMYRGDIRLELGAIMNEECTIAKNRHIAFITVGQLNRVADDKIAESKEKNKKNIVGMIRRSNIGESIQILHNADVVMVVAKEYDDENKILYFGIHKVKGRNKSEGKDFVYQPFVKGSTIRLEEDLGRTAVHKDSLAPGVGIQALQQKIGMKISNKLSDLGSSYEDIGDIAQKRGEKVKGVTATRDIMKTNLPMGIWKASRKRDVLAELMEVQLRGEQEFVRNWTYVQPSQEVNINCPWSIRPEVYQVEPPWSIRM